MKIYEKNDVMVSVDEHTGTIVSVAKLIPSSDNKNIVVPVDSNELLFFKEYLDIDLGNSSCFKCNIEIANLIIKECFLIESNEVLKINDDEPLSEAGTMAIIILDKIYDSYESGINNLQGS